MTGDQLRAGVLGVGRMGRHHVRILGQLDGVRLVGVADSAGDRFDAVRELDVAVVPDLDALLALRLDLCVVALPTSAHAAAALQLAAARVPALIEKPLADTLRKGREIVAAFERAGVIAGVGHIERYNPLMQLLRDKLAMGLLGEMFQIATIRESPPPGRVHDVGVVMDLALHDLDLTAWLGNSEYAELAAQISRSPSREHEDLVAIVGSLKNGIIVNHLANWLSPNSKRTVTATGEYGCLEADNLTGVLRLWHSHASPTRAAFHENVLGIKETRSRDFIPMQREPLRSELTAFRDAVMGHSNTFVSAEDSLASLRVAESVLAAARSGECILVDGGSQ